MVRPLLEGCREHTGFVRIRSRGLRRCPGVRREGAKTYRWAIRYSGTATHAEHNEKGHPERTRFRCGWTWTAAGARHRTEGIAFHGDSPTSGGSA